MRPTSTACVWLPLIAVVLLVACADAGHGKRKKIVVLIPEKVKHIHHHHIKKVYLKQRPVEYYEDDGLHRADEAVGPEQAVAASDSDKVQEEEEAQHPAWGHKTQVTRSFETHVSTAPAPGTAERKVGRSSEVHDEGPGHGPGPDPGAVYSKDGWSAMLHHKQHQLRQQQAQHAQQTTRPRPQQQQQQQTTRHRPQQKQQHQQQQTTRHRPQQQQQHPPKKYHSEWEFPVEDFPVSRPSGKRYEEEIPDDIRAWVNEGFEKFKSNAGSKKTKKTPLQSDEIRVEVVDDVPRSPQRREHHEEPSRTPHRRHHHHADRRHLHDRHKPVALEGHHATDKHSYSPGVETSERRS